MKTFLTIAGTILLSVCFIALSVSLVAVIVMNLWNWLVVAAFGVAAISFFQALVGTMVFGIVSSFFRN